MPCPSMKEKLSTYLDDLLLPEEKAEVENHLKSCSRCREYFDELAATIGRVKNLEEIEPPPWLKQKVMARIREEAGLKKGIFSRLFSPLSVKLPAGALATIAIAVITVYIFKSVEPDVKLAKAPHDEAARIEVPAAVKPKDSEKPGPVRKEPALESQKSAPKKEAAPPAAESTLPAPFMKKAEPRPQAAAPASGEPGVKASEKDRQASVSSEGPRHPEEPAVLQAKTDQSGTVNALQEMKKAAPPAFATTPMKKEAAVERAADSVGKNEQAVAMPGQRASVEVKQGEVSLTLMVEDAATGTEKVKKAVRSLGGAIIREEVFETKKVLLFDIPSRQYKELLERLGSFGEIGQKAAPQEAAPAQLSIRIEVSEKSR